MTYIRNMITNPTFESYSLYSSEIVTDILYMQVSYYIVKHPNSKTV